MSLLSDIAVPIAKLVNMKKYKEKDFLNPRRDTDFLNKKNFDKMLILEEQFIDEYQVLTVFSEESYNKHVLAVFKNKAKFLISGLEGSSAAVLGASAVGWEL